LRDVQVLITGGAGFVGSTIASACEDAGHHPVLIDDLSRGARAFTAGRPFYEGDVADRELLRQVFAEHPGIAAAVHCAGSIVVPESVERPLQYYRNNVAKTVELIENLHDLGCSRLLLSSSASIYGPSPDLVVDENSPICPTSPYARTKAMVEDVLRDAAIAGVVSAVALRYFNPVGADPKLRSGLQVPHPTHAWGRLIAAHLSGEPFTITGVDWPTRDGSAVRDFVHVWDVARAHVEVLEQFDRLVGTGFEAINIGTGSGTTIRELVAAFEVAAGASLEVHEGPARPGDAVGCYASVGKAATLLGWQAKRSVIQAFQDGLAWARIRADRLSDADGARPADQRLARYQSM
jgi:UDP-glucose 4-epimerase